MASPVPQLVQPSQHNARYSPAHPGAGAPKVTLDESRQRKLIQRLLDEDSVPVEARFAGLFIAVFGQSATRVLAFRRDQLLITDDVVQLILHQRPVMLPERVSELQGAARFQLAGTLPAKVLADMLGFHVGMFEAYARLSNGTWGDYPSLRAIHRDRSLQV